MLLAALAVAYFDSRFYFFEHHLPVFGVAILASLAVFAVLFFLRSRYAWHAAGIVFVAILPIALLLTYQGGYMGFPLTWRLAVVDLVIYALLAAYIWRSRAPYFCYIAPKEI